MNHCLIFVFAGLLSHFKTMGFLPNFNFEVPDVVRHWLAFFVVIINFLYVGCMELVPMLVRANLNKTKFNYVYHFLFIYYLILF